MKIIKGNKKIDLNKNQLQELTSDFKKIVLDLGTGDGRFVYKNAKNNPETFYIGVDPSEKSLEEFSKKAVRQKLNNVLFVVGSLELFPAELDNIADELFINLPWGSLLQAVANPMAQSLNVLKNILKTNGQLTIIFGYDANLEPGETKRLNLTPITEKQVKERIIPEFEKNGFITTKFSTMDTVQLKDIESTWGKKISLRPERPLFVLIFLRGN